MEILPLFFLLIALTLASAFFSSSETAFFSLSSPKIKTYQKSEDPKKLLIAKLLSHPRDLLVTVFMLNTLVNILIQNVASSIFGQSASWNLKIGVPFILTLLFGEIIPKYIGLQNNVWISEISAPLLNILQRMLKPLRKWVIAITEPISKTIFFFLKKEKKESQKEFSEQELTHLIKESASSGLLTKAESELAKGYLIFQNSTVRELMRPREEMLFFKLDEPLSSLIDLFVDQECSKVPVSSHNIDSILGIISLNTFFIHENEIKQPKDLISFLKKPLYVNENSSAQNLLLQFQKKNEELALVVDEYGAISGLLTLEDLKEVVVGEIQDLRDQEPLFIKTSENELIASGKLELSQFNEIFATDFESPHQMVTLAGFLIDHFGEIPQVGAQTELEGILFQVVEREPNRIKKIYIHRKGSCS